MSGYIGVNLRDILVDETLGESAAKSLLSSFSCPLNPDVEHFLRNVAIFLYFESRCRTFPAKCSYRIF